MGNSNGSEQPQPSDQQVVKARLEQIKNQQVKSSPEWLDSLKHAQQSNKDRAAKVAQAQTETPNPNAPRAKDTPPYHGPPDIVAEKNRLLNLPPEERLKIVKEQTLSTLRQEWKTALQAGDNPRAAQLLRLISNLDNSVSEE